jgi:hypothetical protein
MFITSRPCGVEIILKFERVFFVGATGDVLQLTRKAIDNAMARRRTESGLMVAPYLLLAPGAP